MDYDLKKFIYMVMYYFARPTTEFVERMVWFAERIADTQTLVFDWDETNQFPLCDTVRSTLVTMRMENVLKPDKRVPSTVGNSYRNYLLKLNHRDDHPYYDPKLFPDDLIRAIKTFHKQPDYYRTFVASHRYSVSTRDEIYDELNDKFREKSIVGNIRR